ncbi:MAG: hypothetical protein P1P84_13615 [Deferrisomatales bacterium]|nr:hypothetical protein [Deferrisomatales bacterium]
MNQYRVAKEALSTWLLLVDGSRREGTLFLAPQSPFHSGPQTVGELMAEGGRTLPFHDPNGRFLLVGKAGVAAVLAPSQRRGEDELLDRISVAVQLAGNHHLRGHYLAEKGAGERLSDALNADEVWFRLECPDALAWVAKDHLLMVDPG